MLDLAIAFIIGTGVFLCGWNARKDYEAILRQRRREFHALEMIHRL
jgi:hypothetical protein